MAAPGWTGARGATGPGHVLLGLVACLVVAVPALVVEEDWHGRPMIDQPGHLFVAPLLVAAVGFSLGGGIAGRHAGRRAAGLWRGAAVGALGSAALVAADVLRRSAHHQALSAPVDRLWLQSAVLATVLAALGGALAQLWSAGHPPERTPPGPAS